MDPKCNCFYRHIGCRLSTTTRKLSAPVPSATPANIISFASFLASNIIGWCPMIPDYGYTIALMLLPREFSSTHILGSSYLM
ncbi:uncharacterized protein BJ212DRAFT_580899 [Suillus subaureus]|uniref:Uncharacterized protein n=1 Tax=Suillus subaureus TaxID=48587 RepID=A0A9P7DJG8_9AGAM|nr:uncharacterized protein BJ212DRAFT_580899 [Suillus subaureus]KAG1795543.1 hypothetical protein BJ212DRAFT_580899 [Suillus subaureus]